MNTRSGGRPENGSDGTPLSCLTTSSPVGLLTVYATEKHVVRLGWGGRTEHEPTPLLELAVSQLASYFAGGLTRFDVPLAPSGSEFQKRVWKAMNDIPYGETATYGEIARRVGTSARTVGGACGANPIPIILPCHRVVAANGRLGGYSGEGGLSTKTRLLNLEHGVRI